MKTVYISSAYYDDPVTRTAEAGFYAEFARKQGFDPIIPQKTFLSAFGKDERRDQEEVMKTLVDKADEIWFFGDITEGHMWDAEFYAMTRLKSRKYFEKDMTERSDKK